MIRGTTPTHTFGIPISEDKVKTIRVTYRQDDRNVVDKGTESVQLEGKTAKVTLTQQETLAFTAGIKAKVKIRVLSTEGQVFSNKKSILIEVDDTFNEEVLV